MATAAGTFFRNCGATIGTAVLLTILFSAASTSITAAYRAARGTDSFQRALAKQPEQQTALAHGLSQGLGGTSFLAHLDPTIAAPFLNGFAHAMDLTALVAAAVAAAGFVLSLVLHEQPLRTMSAEVAGKPNLAAQRTATTN